MPFVKMRTRRVEYDIEIHGKYTLIRGDSATGKTTLYHLAELAAINSPAVTLESDKQIKVVQRDASDTDFERRKDCIYIIDESCTLLRDPNIASTFKNSDNYFIIIYRVDKFGYLPVGTDNICRLQIEAVNGIYKHTLVPMQQRFILPSIINPEVIITEDLKSSYLFIKELLSEHSTKLIVEPAYGNGSKRNTHNASASKVVTSAKHWIEQGVKELLVVYDAIGFGHYIEELIDLIDNYPGVKIHVIDWDSFEGYVLASPVYNKHYTRDDAGCYYNSFEHFLTEKLEELIPKYNKGRLPDCLKRNRCTVNCKQSQSCEYSDYTYDDLIYGPLKILEDNLKDFVMKPKTESMNLF